ncbi:DUF3276 family protein [Fontivita pretiosa]|uniref:DUF3276 family protein n=1 Tax=Fontivita pretiosa TaxID=2989684 RepID=UPI003D16F039
MPQQPAPAPGAEARILFQKYFKSVGPRTYAAQVKQAGNGNHFLVLTEGKRDPKTEELRKTRLFVFSEDFEQFLQMIDEAAQFIREHPVPQQVRQQRQRYWARQNGAERQPQRQPDTKRAPRRPAARP